MSDKDNKEGVVPDSLNTIKKMPVYSTAVMGKPRPSKLDPIQAAKDGRGSQSTVPGR